MEQLEVKHRNERGGLSKVQEKELDQIKQMYERDMDKLRQNHKTDLEKRVWQTTLLSAKVHVVIVCVCLLHQLKQEKLR